MNAGKSRTMGNFLVTFLIEIWSVTLIISFSECPELPISNRKPYFFTDHRRNNFSLCIFLIIISISRSKFFSASVNICLDFKVACAISHSIFANSWRFCLPCISSIFDSFWVIGFLLKYGDRFLTHQEMGQLKQSVRQSVAFNCDRKQNKLAHFFSKIIFGSK